MPLNSPRSTIELVVLGGGGVGKSSVTIQYVQDFFIPWYDPTIEDSYRRQVVVDEQTSLLQILDTAGQDEFQVMLDGWIRNGDCFMLVFSATSRRSFEELEKYRTKLQQVKDTEHQVPVVILMNKIDLVDERQVEVEEAEELAKRWGVPLVQASAKTNKNIKAGFEELVREHRKHVMQTAPKVDEKLRARRRALLSSCSIM